MSCNNQFYLELKKSTGVVISLMQKYRLFGEVREFVPCGCLVFEVSLAGIMSYKVFRTFLFYVLLAKSSFCVIYCIAIRVTLLFSRNTKCSYNNSFMLPSDAKFYINPD